MKLLLAEDERELSGAVVRVLKHNNYTVDAVYDGAEALEYLTYGEYDGVILDIMMPKADGLTVLRTIRAQGNNVPVILLTAKSEVDDRVEGLDAGADDYLSKPFAMKELLGKSDAQSEAIHNFRGQRRNTFIGQRVSDDGNACKKRQRSYIDGKVYGIGMGLRQRGRDKRRMGIYLVVAQKTSEHRRKREHQSGARSRIQTGKIG